MVSKSLDLDLLLHAYASGIFPMADHEDDEDVYWVEPRTRGILPLDQFHLSKSLSKSLKSDKFLTSANRAFEQVVYMCGAPTQDRPSTWINGQIAEAVAKLHQRGQAHSIETWHEGHLVGGLYGVSLGRAFFGESMFSRKTDASKIALAHLVARLRFGGFALLDCQFITPHLQSLGAIEIDRSDYMERLNAAVSDDLPNGDFGAYSMSLYDDEDGSSSRVMTVSSPISGCDILQSLTHTS